MLASWSPSRFNQAPGFTLVEILVVLIIVSVMSGIVVTSLPSSFQNSDFDEESLRLKTVIELIREESLTRASEYGLKTDKDNYSFFVYNEIEQNWTQQYLTSPTQLSGQLISQPA